MFSHNCSVHCTLDAKFGPRRENANLWSPERSPRGDVRIVRLTDTFTPPALAVSESCRAISPRSATFCVGDYRDEDLPQRNLVSALIALENSRSAESLRRAVDALADWLRGPGEQALKRSFGEWIRQVLWPGRFGSAELPSIPRLEEVRMMLAERVKEWTEEWLREGREQGLEEGLEKGRAEERALLCRMAGRKFDAETAQGLSGLLDGLTDPGKLNEIGEWIIECDTGADLLERARDVAKRP